MTGSVESISDLTRIAFIHLKLLKNGLCSICVVLSSPLHLEEVVRKL